MNLKEMIKKNIKNLMEKNGIELFAPLDIKIEFGIKVPNPIGEVNLFTSPTKTIEVAENEAEVVNISVGINYSYSRGEYDVEDGYEFIAKRISSYAFNCLLEDME